MKFFPRLLFIAINVFVLSCASSFFLIYLKIKEPLKRIKTVDERPMAYMLSLIFISMLTLSTITIFLNILKTIRRNVKYSMLSFFLLPLLTIIYLVMKVGSIDTYVASIVFPFSIILIINFAYYRNHLALK